MKKNKVNHLQGIKSKQMIMIFWAESYASDDDEVPTKQVSQDIMKEVSLTINEAKLEKRVMRHSEIHKFCDATLNRVLEEEIEVRLKYRNQMRRWEMYVNGRPLGPRRERPE
ncbi:hypothetical protein Tco_0039011 [Tanacetum coccineum]